MVAGSWHSPVATTTSSASPSCHSNDRCWNSGGGGHRPPASVASTPAPDCDGSARTGACLARATGTSSSHFSPLPVARSPKCRSLGPHGLKDSEGIADTTSSRAPLRVSPALGRVPDRPLDDCGGRSPAVAVRRARCVMGPPGTRRVLPIPPVEPAVQGASTTWQNKASSVSATSKNSQRLRLPFLPISAR